MVSRVTETGRAGATQAGRLVAAIEPYLREGVGDPEVRAAARRAIVHSRRVGGRLRGEDMASALRQVAGSRRVQDEIGRSARAIGDVALRVTREAERRRRGRRVRLLAVLLVAGAVAGGLVALRRRGGGGDGGGRGTGAPEEARPAGSPVPF